MRTFARSAFFVSGAAGLVFEIVWLRHLGLALGATTLAVATTTAAYMGGLALGSHLGGRIADRLRRPLAAYGLMELAVGALGLAVPLACRAIPVLDERWLAGLESGAGRALVRFFVALLVLIVPTTAMGMTLPVLSRAVVERADTVGREVGSLYAVNLAGAVLGAALAGFVLIPKLGLAATNGVAVGLDVLLGLAAIGFGLRHPSAAVAPERGAAPEPPLRPGGRLLVSLLVVTGAAAMALQVLWTRGLGTALGPSTYAFSAIVCAYLVGLAAGGAVASRLADRVRSTRVALAMALLVTAAAALAGIAVIDDLPILLRPVVLDPALTAGGFFRTEFLLAALSLLPATAGMGSIFPLTIAAVVASERRVGAAVGRAYALNTAGNILGSFAGVFVLLPALGVERGMRAAALAYVAAAAVLTMSLEAGASRRMRALLAGGCVAAAAALALWPRWDVGRWTLGTFRASFARSFFADKVIEPRILFHADGLASTVTVEEDEGVRWVKVNGKIDGSSEGDMPTQLLSGLVPMLAHPAPRRVAIIGCGTCVTAGAVLAAGPERAVLIELEPQVLAAARLFADVNHEPWNDPRLTVVEDDGRNYLMRPGPPFDVIVSEPSNPWMTGAAGLFTLEFFRIAERRLAPGGMFLQWLQSYELAPERIAAVLATFHAVFPHMVVLSAHPDSNDLLLLGSRDPISLPRERLKARVAALAPELARADVQSVDELYALVLVTDAEMGELAAVRLNTDDNALIEFGAPRDLVAYAESDAELPLFAHQAGKRPAMAQRLSGDGTPEGLAALAAGYLREGMLADALLTARRARAGTVPGAPTERAAAETEELALLLSDQRDREPVLEVEGLAPTGAFAVAAQLAARGEFPKAITAIDERRPGGAPSPGELLLYGWVLYREDRYPEAHRALERAAKAAGSHLQPAIAYYRAKASFGDGELARAVTEMRQYRAVTTSPLSLSRKAE